MTASGSLPRAVISLRALRVSARAAAQRGGATADLRADALGHGVRECAPVVADAGIRRVLVDDVAVAAELHAAGIDAVTSGVADIDSVALYGLPGSGVEPVMELSGRILSRKPLHAGEAVSYGYTHRAECDTTVALVTGGYAQGIVRALGNRAQVGVGAASRPIVGRVAMDVCVVDLQGDDAGTDEIVFFGGRGPARESLHDWAQITGMRTTELVAVAGTKAVREWTT